MKKRVRFKEGKVLKRQFMTIIYLAFMLLFYIGYISLDSYRINKSEYWISKINLTQEDVQSISRLADWTSIFEMMFIASFIIVACIMGYSYRRDKQVFKRFLLLHISLFTTILLMSYALAFVMPSPIGNLTQPLIIPIFIIVIILIYFGFMKRKKKLFKGI